MTFLFGCLLLDFCDDFCEICAVAQKKKKKTLCRLLCDLWVFLFKFRLQLHNPGHYSPLEAFYEDKRALLPPSGDGVINVCPNIAWGAAMNNGMHPEMKVGTNVPSLFPLSFLHLNPRLTNSLHPTHPLSVNTCGPDHTPGWLYVPVHSLLWWADHGALETGPAA